MDGKEMNGMNPEMNAVVLLFVSRANPTSKLSIYYANNDTYGFSGTYTNEAPVSYLIKAAIDMGFTVSKLLCIISDSVETVEIADGKTSIQLFKEFIDNLYVNGLCYEDHGVTSCITLEKPIDICKIKYDESEQNPNKLAYMVYQQIQNELNGETNVFVDYSGGFRDMSFLMVSIIRYLEFGNIQCRKIVYSQQRPNEIKELGYAYDMFELVSSVDSFLTTGSAKQLGSLYKKHGTHPSIQKLTDAITRFSQSISVCSVIGLDQAVIDLSKAVDEFVTVDTDGDYYAELFKSLIPTIISKMKLNQMIISNSDGSVSIDYSILIEWCLENGLLQQALTLYIEKLPMYYFQHGYIPHVLCEYDDDDLNDAENLARKFYIDMFSHIADMPQCALLSKEMVTVLEDSQPDGYESILQQHAENSETAFQQQFQKIHDVLWNGPNKMNYGRKQVNLNNCRNQLKNPKDNNTAMLFHYVLFDDGSMYEQIPTKPQNDRNNYRKKEYAFELMNGSYSGMNAVQKKTFELLENREYLAEIMKYYLAAKMFRNRVNHASEQNVTNDEKSAAERLEAHGVRIDLVYDNMLKVLSEGLEASIRPNTQPSSCTEDIHTRYSEYFHYAE